MTAERPASPPIPEHVRLQLPEWSPLMRKVRRAMHRGYVSEASIGYAVDADAWSTRGALELLALIGEIEMSQDARWKGLTSATTKAGSMARAEAQARERTA